MRRLRTALGAGLLATSLAFGLSACSQSAESVSASLHASVVQVATRAQAGDYLGAIAALALLDKDVTAAVDAGTIGAEQEAQIREAIALVQADLEAAEVASTLTPTPSNEDGQKNDKNDKPDKQDKKDKKDRGNGNGASDRGDD